MKDSKQILWGNILTLMIQRYGEQNNWRCAHEAGVGPGTLNRIEEQKTEVRLETLEKFAKLFGVEPYQLLIPGLGSPELMVLQQMKGMCADQKITLTKIGATLAEPKEKSQA